MCQWYVSAVHTSILHVCRTYIFKMDPFTFIFAWYIFPMRMWNKYFSFFFVCAELTENTNTMNARGKSKYKINKSCLKYILGGYFFHFFFGPESQCNLALWWTAQIATKTTIISVSFSFSGFSYTLAPLHWPILIHTYSLLSIYLLHSKINISCRSTENKIALVNFFRSLCMCEFDSFEKWWNKKKNRNTEPNERIKFE